MVLEAGKRYWMRCGAISPTVEHPTDALPNYFRAGPWTFETTGRFLKNQEHSYDLVAEYMGPELTVPPEASGDSMDHHAEWFRHKYIALGGR